MATQVVGYDGTDGARAALDAAVALAAELSDSLVVVFAHQVSQLGGEVHDYEGHCSSAAAGCWRRRAASPARPGSIPSS
jgi:hypothetical protein